MIELRSNVVTGLGSTTSAPFGSRANEATLVSISAASQHRLTVEGLTYLRNLDRESDSRS
jgi:hypothetical protein